MECDTILLKKVKEAVRKEYIYRLQVIQIPFVSSKNNVMSIGAYATLLLRYGFGVLHLTQAELRGLDIKTRKVLAKANFYHE